MANRHLLVAKAALDNMDKSTFNTWSRMERLAFITASSNVALAEFLEEEQSTQQKRTQPTINPV